LVICYLDSIEIELVVPTQNRKGSGKKEKEKEKTIDLTLPLTDKTFTDALKHQIDLFSTMFDFLILTTDAEFEL